MTASIKFEPRDPHSAVWLESKCAGESGHIGFVTLTGAQKDSRTSDFDGLLTVGLFKRVFIDHTEHFAVLEPF